MVNAAVVSAGGVRSGPHVRSGQRYHLAILRIVSRHIVVINCVTICYGSGVELQHDAGALEAAVALFPSLLVAIAPELL